MKTLIKILDFIALQERKIRNLLIPNSEPEVTKFKATADSGLFHGVRVNSNIYENYRKENESGENRN